MPLLLFLLSVSVVTTDVADPDIAETHRVAMVLKNDWAFWSVWLRVVGNSLVFYSSDKFFAVVKENSVVKNGDVGLFDELAIFPAGGFENDVVGLPGARFLGGIPEWWKLAVHGSALSVGVTLVVVRIEKLNFVIAVNDDSTVATALTGTFNFGGCGELKVKLKVSEVVFGFDGTGFGFHFHVAVFDFPCDRFACFGVYPIVEIGAVEEYSGVGRRRCHMTEGFAGFDNGWTRAIVVVHTPFSIRK